MKRKYLDSYPLSKGKEMRIYWIPGEPHRPVEIQMCRIGDGVVLHTVRKSREEASDILEVDSILKNAERNRKIPKGV